MFRLISILLVIVLLSSCRTKQNIVETATKQKTDSIIVERTIVKDSIITVILPRDTVVIDRIIKQDNLPYVKDIDTIIVEHGIVGAKAWLIKNHLGVRAYVSDSTLFYKLKAAKTISERYQKLYYSEFVKHDKTKVVYKNTGFAKFTIWYFIISIVVLFLLLVLKFKGVI